MLRFQVLTSSLSIEQVEYIENSNFWIGPRQVGRVEFTNVASVSRGVDYLHANALLSLKQYTSAVASITFDKKSENRKLKKNVTKPFNIVHCFSSRAWICLRVKWNFCGKQE